MSRRRYADYALRMRASRIIIKKTSQTNKTRDLVRAVATKVVNREPNVQQMDKDAANAKE